MEFCETCGSLLKPVKEDDKVFLYCAKCDKKVELTKSDDYKLKRKIEHSPRERLEITEVKKRRALTDEEREELEDYYGDMLEQMEID
ncbi:MAG: hypothetical protein GF308_09695 [Candidatus Heimdallarchaeota archaeon]|nr:hypothetical protein [Candidatus Heimdallarchaeota archaeon]